jgi:tetratricopeptide (TPR) repeat protein
MWQSRPVFISSTFADMQAERDYLRTRVFPELEERLAARRHNLEWVDLRLGVATASQRDEHVRELHVLKVCLDEVRRCRPFLIVLLGDRYGWVPPEERIKAAAEEAREGFSADVAGRSVTDLEIEFGVLSDPDQQPRSFFYFREPLPYTQMPAEIAALYCEDYAADPAKADSKTRLAALKRRIGQQLPARVRHYAVTWDREHQRVAGLEDFGHMVLDDIWTELEAETPTSAAAADIPWQQAEREALEDFIDDRARDFVGRQGILVSLTGLATAAGNDGPAWGTCVTGDPGSGKSALFGELYRRLQGSDVFLLAHAAGASVHAASVDSMLRRWIGELAGALGTDPGLADNADPDTVDTTFARLLGKMAQERRIVVLVDALDQFENTTRGRYVTWLPRLWPANALMLATAIAGDASKALAERRAIQALSLPPLDAAEARDIIAGICRRYHRTFEPEVVEALLTKRGPDGPAWGNPLWLVLAVEDLNLLDADDFDRAQRDYAGEPAARLRALMLDTVADYPPDIAGLYAHTFERAEEVFGASLARGFLGLIAVSRAGWRESDFRILLPRASEENWDELKFAQLRRLFRGQLRRRGALAQWDFSHAQMRAAVRARFPAWSVREQNLHAMIADRLLSSPLTDPLRISEMMVHLLASEDWTRAAGYYGDRLLTNEELEGATQVLVQSALNDPTELKAVLSVLSARSPSTDILRVDRYLNVLLPALEGRANAKTKEALALVIRILLDKLHQQYPKDLKLYYDVILANIALGECSVTLGNVARANQWYRDALELAQSLRAVDVEKEEFQLAVRSSLTDVHNRLGRIAWLQGDLDGAVESYSQSLWIANDNCNKSPRDRTLRNSLAVSLEKWAEVQVARGQLSTAESSLREAVVLRESLVTEEPNNLMWQPNFGACHIMLGDVQRAEGDSGGAELSYRASVGIFERLVSRDPTNANWQRDLSVSYERLGDELLERDDLPAAETAYRSALTIATRLADQESGNTGWQRDLSIAHRKIGDAQQKRSDLSAAEDSYRAALTITRRLAALDSTNAQWLRDVGVSLNDLGDIQLARGDVHGAANSFGEAMTISERLSRQNPDDTEWQRDLGISYDRLAKVQMRLKEFGKAAELCRASLSIAQELTRRDPSNATWKRDLATSYNRIGDVLIALGDLEGALKSYQDQRDILSQLAESDPGNVFLQRGFAACQQSIGNALKKQSDHAGALKYYQAALAIVKTISQSDANNADDQSALSDLYGVIGDILLEQDNLSEAMKSLQERLAVAERLADANPGDAARQMDLSIAYNQLGIVLKGQGNLPEALQLFRDGLSVRERLALAEPDDPRRQDALALAQIRVGDIYYAQGDSPEALKSFNSSLAIRKHLAQSNPENAGWQYDLAMSYSKVGSLFMRTGEKPKALEALRGGLAVMEGLATQYPGVAKWKSGLAWHEEQIAKLGEGNEMSDEKSWTSITAENANTILDHGWSLLQVASQHGQYDLAKELIKCGAAVNAGGPEGKTALHLACAYGRTDCIQLLLESGADINAADSYQQTPLHAAAGFGHEAAVQLLVDAGAKVNAAQVQGSTALHLAALNGQTSIVRFLVQKGADANIRDVDGLTAADIARAERNNQIVELLEPGHKP